MLQLHQIRPNPFVTKTLIEYELTANAIVELRVHNLIGETLRMLTGGCQTEGAYRLLWDGTDDDGSPLPSGLYFCTLSSATGCTDSKEILLLR
jgi:flagellar hook assembly protein FlgD